MSAWKKSRRVDELNAMAQNTIHDPLAIQFVEIGDDWLSANMPVAPATHQPFGLLHGGASVVLAESLGSMAAFLACADDEIPVGIEISANHLRAVRQGTVTGVAKPVHLGRTLHVWNVEIKDEGGNLINVSRLTVLIRAAEARPT